METRRCKIRAGQALTPSSVSSLAPARTVRRTGPGRWRRGPPPTPPFHEGEQVKLAVLDVEPLAAAHRRQQPRLRPGRPGRALEALRRPVGGGSGVRADGDAESRLCLTLCAGVTTIDLLIRSGAVATARLTGPSACTAPPSVSRSPSSDLEGCQEIWSHSGSSYVG